MAVQERPQTAIDEKVVESLELESALGRRQDAKDAAGEARKAYKAADDAVKAKVEELDLTDGQVVRIGSYRITKRAVEGRSVSFETSPSSRITIARVDD